MREVELPDGVRGRLWLSGLPGRWRGMAEELDCWQQAGIERVVCLVPWEELEDGSPDYAEAARAGSLSCTWVHYPMDDFGIPEDEEDIVDLANETAATLRGGGSVLVHCHVGIGRTGTVATCTLLTLGLDAAEAIRRVRAAGSDPETVEQGELVARVAAAISRDHDG